MPTTYKRIAFLTFAVLILLAVPPLLYVVLVMGMNEWRCVIAPAVHSWRRRVRNNWFVRPLRASRTKIRRKLRPRVRAINTHVVARYRQPKTGAGIFLCTIAILLALVWLFSHMRAETTDDYIGFSLKQAALTLVLAISILALFWIVFPIARAFKSLFVTAVATFLVSACILVSRLFAIDFFSSHFPFSVSYLPVAFGVGTVLLAFAFTSVIFIGLAALFEICMLLVLPVADFKRDLWITYMLVFASALGLLGV